MFITVSLIWLGKGRERAILNLCNQHMEKIVGSVSSLRENVYAFCDNDEKKIEASFKEVSRREREADEIKKKILSDLSKGVFHPINRDEIIRLVLTADDIATNAEATTRRLKFFSPREIGGELKKMLKELSDILLDEIKLLSKASAILTRRPKEAIKLALTVEKVEEKIDDFRMEKIMPVAIDSFNRSKKAGFCLILKDVIDHLENVADFGEDVADVIRGIAIGHA